MRQLFVSVICGIVIGASTYLFITTLQAVTAFFQQHLVLIWFLPLVGLMTGLIYHFLGQEVVSGSTLVIEEIHQPTKLIPFRMAPFIYLTTLMTHLVGGSAGREGTAVQMAASLSDQIVKIFKLDAKSRTNILIAATGAGFGSAIGAPIAGIIFGMEVLFTGRFQIKALFESVLVSAVAFLTADNLGIKHTNYMQILNWDFSLTKLFWMAMAGLVFGLMARLFIISVRILEKAQKRLILFAPLRPFLGGFILVILFKGLHLYGTDSFQFAGLGLDSILSALQTNLSFSFPFLKYVFTVFTVGTGFKGGEFIPLVFIGTTLGSALSTVIPISVQLLASVGFSSVFAAAARAPIACTIMAVELFGAPILPYALIGCMTSYMVSGSSGIYKGQKSSRII